MDQAPPQHEPWCECGRAGVLLAGLLVALSLPIGFTGCSLPRGLSSSPGDSAESHRHPESTASASTLQARPVTGSPAVTAFQYGPENDAARFLAGLPGGSESELRSLRETPEWLAHRQRMDYYWQYYGEPRLAHIAAWRTSEMADLAGAPLVFYPFSGPDFLFADAFFPHASYYVMCGLEGPDAVPDIRSLSSEEIAAGLTGVTESIDTLLGAGYFVTREMRTDLARTRFQGTLPLVYVFLARSGHDIISVRPVGLDSRGGLYVRENGGGHAAPGYHIDCRAPSGQRKDIYYFQQNLADSNLRQDPRILTFTSSLGAPVTFLKSASYLMHSDEFSLVRSHILNHSVALLQDPSGVPYRLLDTPQWNLVLYGNYQGTLDIFRNYPQEDLAYAYRAGYHPVQRISFGVGYLHDPARTSLILARLKLRATPVAMAP